MKSTISQNRSFLMGLAMIAIVIFHHSLTFIPGISHFFNRFGLWGVDIFLFLSGFGCVYALQKYSKSTFFRKRLIRILPTCVIAGILVCGADLILNAERTHAILPLRLFSLHRWYIQAIIICYLLAPVFYYLIRKYRVSGLITIALASTIIEWLLPESDIYRIRWAFGRMPVFVIGMYIAKFDFHIRRWQNILSWICLFIAIYLRCSGRFLFFQWTYFLALAMPMICEVLCKLRGVCVKLGLYRPIEILGLSSLEIYLIHEYTLWVLEKVDIPLWSKYIYFFTSVGIGVYVVYLLSLYIQKKAKQIINL